MDQKKKQTYSRYIWIALLVGFGIAYLVTYIAAFMGQGGRYHTSIATMLFFLIILVVGCVGFLLSRLYRARDQLLDRIGALEASIQELKEVQKP